MEKLLYKPESEALCPHGPDVLERAYADGGFSSGWAMHFKPTPRYYFDAHIHYKGGEDSSIVERVQRDSAGAASLGLKRALIFLQVYGKKWDVGMRKKTIMDQFPYFTAQQLLQQLKGEENSEQHIWAAYMNYASSEPDVINAAADAGIRCIKLHNAAVIEDNVQPEVWLSDEWQACFAAFQQRQLPINFHVTQRLSGAPYTGGGRNSYWATGWKKGVTYTNEDLLQVFLTLCRRWPGVNFIGAHQLHIGWQRLDELFTAYPNLHVDTSVGCRLHLDDDFYPQDRAYLREVFIKWADRILFGTDSFWGRAEATTDNRTVLEHMRFLMALGLPQDVLDKVCHGNLERLCRLAPLA